MLKRIKQNATLSAIVSQRFNRYEAFVDDQRFRQNSLRMRFSEELAKHRVPCMAAFISPFRIVSAADSVPWEPTIEDVNKRRWDYAELHRLVGGVDVGLPAPYHMVVARDGAVGLPVLPPTKDIYSATEQFNQCFAALLVGGVYCEAINPDGLEFGFVLDWRYLRLQSDSQAAPNVFHRQVRLQMAPPIEAARLVGPRTIEVTAIEAAMRVGRSVLGRVPEISPEFLLKGVTGVARRDWAAALSNLWVVVEQITSHLWEQRVLTPARANRTVTGRLDQLADTRTWTVATRHELLHQVGALPASVLSELSVARRARNALAHRGQHPGETESRAAYASTLSLLEIACGELPIPLKGLDLADHTLSDPFVPREAGPIEPTHWMPIPKLPGEEELERLEAIERSPGRSDAD